MVMQMPSAAQDLGPRRTHVYRRTPEPVYFPSSEEVPETTRHLEQRTLLYLILKREIARRATIGSDQFVYYDPTTAKKNLAPDVFVRLDAPHRPITSWKTWERGAPELGVEIISAWDARDRDWEDKLARYRAAGVAEVVRFDAEDREAPLRVWDRVDGDLVERSPDDPALRACETLGLWWVVVARKGTRTLRLARDRQGEQLLPTADEGEKSARKEATTARKEAAAARKKAARLEAELEALRAEVQKAKPRARPKKAK